MTDLKKGVVIQLASRLGIAEDELIEVFTRMERALAAEFGEAAVGDSGIGLGGIDIELHVGKHTYSLAISPKRRAQ